MSVPFFDYVIVGAGTAGCVLANRLSAGGARVVLLEAGPRDRNWKIHTPPGFVKLFKTKLDWAYTTEPEPHLHGRRLYWPRGRVLGGSSSLNAMLYVRGHRRDYDGWRELGNPGWGYDDVLPYFKRAQNQERGTSEHHGTGGPINVADPIDPNPLSHAFVAAGEELGWPRNDDFNGAHQRGVGLYQVTQRGGRRSSGVEYLRAAAGRPSLVVETGCQALRVLFEGHQARSVEVVQGGRKRTFTAEREVVLAAGALGSPHLLMLSGVGPADMLQARGVEVVADSPGVGRNLQDHLALPVVSHSRRPVTLDSAETLGNLLRYLFKKRGPFTSTVCEAGAFVRTDPALPQPDLQFHFLPAGLVDHGFDKAAEHGFNCAPTLTLPKSRGFLELGSADPLVPVRIHAHYFAEPDDLALMVEGVKIARRLARTKAMASYFGGEAVPGDGVRTDAEIADYLRQNVATLYHPVGTCRMGPEGTVDDGFDAPPVVDPELRVHGVEGLRVVDASVMPRITGGNTNAPTHMIAEKASDLILGTILPCDGDEET